MNPAFSINGMRYDGLHTVLLSTDAERPDLEDLKRFLDEWLSPLSVVSVQSSGSTGAPKKFFAEKERMKASARMTCSFLGLKPGDTALLCMPLKFIGAKMMVVRSIEYGLDLIPVKPSSHPMRGLDEAPVFAAMTPAQAATTLEVPEEAALLRRVKQLILGGGAPGKTLLAKLRDFPNAVWSTYGMTETLSHIALKPLNGTEVTDFYTPFDGVSVRLTEHGTLAITAPTVCPGELITNDIAELTPGGRFKILGRRDNVINSGGIKLHIESLEETLTGVFSVPFQITAIPHPIYGEVAAVLIQGEAPIDWSARCHEVLPAYACPKQLFTVSQLPITESGKPARAQARELAKKSALAADGK